MRRLLRVSLRNLTRHNCDVAEDCGGGGGGDGGGSGGGGDFGDFDESGDLCNRRMNQLLLDGRLWSDDDDDNEVYDHHRQQQHHHRFRLRALCFCLCASRPFRHFASPSPTSVLHPMLVAVVSDLCECVSAAAAAASDPQLLARELLVRETFPTHRSSSS